MLFQTHDAPKFLKFSVMFRVSLYKLSHRLGLFNLGTGASCIYPLLGCRQNGWQFLASEVDDQNIFFAEKNIQQNKMTDKITGNCKISVKKCI